MHRNIFDIINNAYGTFTKSQRKLANAVLNSFAETMHMSCSSLAKFVGVSQSTVVRFIAVLGYENYTTFKKELRDYALCHMKPTERITHTVRTVTRKSFINDVKKNDIECIRYTMDMLKSETVTAAVKTLFAANKIYIAACGQCCSLALMLHHAFSFVFDNVILLAGMDGSELAANLIKTKQSDVLIVINATKEENSILNAAIFAKQEGAKVIAFLPFAENSMSDIADIIFRIKYESMSFIDSFAPYVSVINALLIELTNANQQFIRNRLTAYENVRKDFR